MNLTKKLSWFFGLLGAFLLVVAAVLSFSSLNTPAKLLFASKDAEQRTVEYMDAVCRADLEAVGAMMAGQAGFYSSGELDSELASFLWDAYVKSISYAFSDGCYASDSGLSRDVRVTVLDIPAVMKTLKARSQELLAQQASVTDGDLVFVENGQYREEFAMGVLYEGAAAILKEGGVSKDVTLTLQLTYQDGQWYILPNPAVTNILSGSIGE